MRSQASYDGHPLHPALIPFPFAFLTGAFAFDAFGWLLDWPSLSTTAGHLMALGIVAALAAAVPGFIDYFYTVPPLSTGKQRATKHMLVMLSAVALFTIACLLRDTVLRLAVLGIELVAAGLLAAGAYMGGILVSRNQISVDHRYAGAGKWKEATIEPRPGTALVVARDDELKVDQMKLLRIGERRVVLARAEDGYVAFDDRCTHRGGSLAGGAMICGTVQCPWHGSQFDVRSGAVKAGPAKDGIQTFRVETRDGNVLMTVP